MAEVLEVKKIGDSLGVIITQRVAEKLRVQEGDKLYLLEITHGAVLTPYDPDLAEALDHTEETIRVYRDDLRALAK